MNYLLDTNILLTYIRNTKTTQLVEDSLNLLSGINNLLVSVVSIGEIHSIAKQNDWGKRKIGRLTELIGEFLISDINTEEIIQRYAEIDAYSQGKLKGKDVKFSARNMGKNDLWIAATASVYDLTLITTDHDFDHLPGVYLNLIKINLQEFQMKG